MKKKKFILVIALLVLSFSVNAAFITQNSISSASVIDFSNQVALEIYLDDLQIGAGIEDITVVGLGEFPGLYTNYDGWSLGTNGTWGNGMTYISTASINGSLIFSFNDGPVAAVGGFINSFPEGDLKIAALDIDMNVLELYKVTQLANILTPGGLNEGAFRGIVRESNDIAFFAVYGYASVLDDLTFARSSAVPVPAAFWLFFSGLIALTGYARFR